MNIITHTYKYLPHQIHTRYHTVLLYRNGNTVKFVCRRYKISRYDDREIIQTNLVDSYKQLMDLAIKHLPDKFYLEGTTRLSLRNIIAREMLVNTLIHREFTSSYTAKFVIEKNRMYVENANRATKNSFITPDNLEPNAKNPIIASFFRTIGWSDQLGTGVRNLFKYANLYSGKDPIFKEGDIFQIVIPLDETFSFDKKIGSDTIQDIIDTNSDTIPNTIDTNSDTINTNSVVFLEKNIEKILDCIKEKPDITQAELGKKLNISLVSVKRAMKELYRRGKLERVGSNRKGFWRIIE